MYGKLVALGNNIDDSLDIAEIDVRADALRVQVESDLDQIDIACPFAISEKTAFDSLRSR